MESPKMSCDQSWVPCCAWRLRPQIISVQWLNTETLRRLANNVRCEGSIRAGLYHSLNDGRGLWVVFRFCYANRNRILSLYNNPMSLLFHHHASLLQTAVCAKTLSSYNVWIILILEFSWVFTDYLGVNQMSGKKKNLYTFTHFRDRNEWKRRDLKFSFRTFTPPSFHVLLLSLPTYGFL